MVFAFDTYYPSGGMNDFEDEFNNLDEAKDYGYSLSDKDHFHVFDIQTRKKVFASGENV